MMTRIPPRTSWIPLLYLFCFSIAVDATKPRPFAIQKRNPTYSPLSTTSLTSLSLLSNLDDVLNYEDPHSTLSQILIPRVAGSSNLSSIQAMISKQFTQLGWHLEKDEFISKTPIGDLPFTNLIFTHNPKATKKFVLSAHLDSKYFSKYPENQFVGATDSAAPCAILIDVAKSLTPWLDSNRDRIKRHTGKDEFETLQIILFDGEEAFVDWTATDSIYGAKHLANKWNTEIVTSPSASSEPPRTQLQQISHLILFDLLGSSNPNCFSFYGNTGWLFDEFMKAEKKLGQAGLLWEGLKGEEYDKASTQVGINPRRTFFSPRSILNKYAGHIEDDHIPFQQLGVPIVHMISVPFPRVWHTLADDAKALHLPTIKAWAMIIRLVTAEYLGLDPNTPIEELGFVPGKEKGRRMNELVSSLRDSRDGISGLEVDRSASVSIPSIFSFHSSFVAEAQ